MSRGYWNEEEPVVIRTGKNALRYYRNAGRLHVGYADFTNKHGEERRGKTVSLDLAAIREVDYDQLVSAVTLFETLAAELRETAAARMDNTKENDDATDL